MENLPFDILFVIFDRLQFENMIKLRLTNKRLKDAVDTYICHKFAVTKTKIKHGVDRTIMPTYVVYVAIDRILRDIPQKAAFYLTILAAFGKIPLSMDLNSYIHTMLRLRDRITSGAKVKLTGGLRLKVMSYHAALFNLITLWLNDYQTELTANKRFIEYKFVVKKSISELRMNIYRTKLSEMIKSIIINSGYYNESKVFETLGVSKIDCSDVITITLIASKAVQKYFDSSVSKQDDKIIVQELSQLRTKSFKIICSFEFFTKNVVYNEVYAYTLSDKRVYLH